MVAPQPGAAFARAAQRRADPEPVQQGRVEAGIEHQEGGRQTAGFCRGAVEGELGRTPVAHTRSVLSGGIALLDGHLIRRKQQLSIQQARPARLTAARALRAPRWRSTTARARSMGRYGRGEAPRRDCPIQAHQRWCLDRLPARCARHGPQEAQPADQDMCDLRASLCLAQEMGARLGGGSFLLRSVPRSPVEGRRLMLSPRAPSLACVRTATGCR